MIYNYLCSKCKTEIEKEHSITEDPEIRCPKCIGIMKRKITGGTGFILKGEGWTGSAKSTESMVKSVQPAVHRAHQEGKI